MSTLKTIAGGLVLAALFFICVALVQVLELVP